MAFRSRELGRLWFTTGDVWGQGSYELLPCSPNIKTSNKYATVSGALGLPTVNCITLLLLLI